MDRHISSPTLRVVSLYLRRKRTSTLLFGLVLLAAGCDIAVPFITQRLIDTLVEFFRKPAGNPFSVLILSSAAILVATIAARVVKSVYDYNLFRTVTQLEDEVRYRATAKYLDLHALFHQTSNSGQIIGRIERGCTSIYSVLYDIVGQSLVPPMLVFAGAFWVLLDKNIWIALTVLVPPPLYLLVSRKLNENLYAAEQKVNTAFETVSKEAYDIAGNVLTVKKFSQEKAEAAYQRDLVAQARVTQYSVFRLWTVVDNTQGLIAVLGRVSVIALAGYFVLRGMCTVGEFVLFVTLQNMAYQPLCQLSFLVPRLKREITRTDRLFALLDEPVRVADKPGAPDLPPFSDNISFKGVWFRYSEETEWVLRNINLDVPAGTKVALVGRSGSGKTTFINLLLRAYDPQRGSIGLDGVDIREIRKDSLRQQVAVVPQEVDLFSRTVAQNIAYGRPGATREEIEEAGRLALAHDFIMGTERGYETIVGERGLRLSGGERQRIGIARAVLRNPAILILDEATSHLDTESERLIQRATDRLAHGRTVFIIAHRLSTVLNADMIVAFNGHEIEAVGTHDELLRCSPTYQTLYSINPEPDPVPEVEADLIPQ